MDGGFPNAYQSAGYRFEQPGSDSWAAFSLSIFPSTYFVTDK